MSAQHMTAVEVKPQGLKCDQLAAPPARATVGPVIHGGRLYFASPSHLWSYGLGS